MEIKDLIYGVTIVFGILTALLSDRFQTKQTRDDVKELKENMVSKDDYERDMDRIKDVNKLQWEKIDEGKRWQSAHEKEAWENRNNLELKIAALHGADQKLEQMLFSIEKKLDGLIEKLGK